MSALLAFDSFCTFAFSALGAIFSATDSVCTLQVLNQDETPFLYSLVFGEGVVNDATSVVLFNAIQNFDLGNFSSLKFLQFIGNFLYLFGASTFLGVAVSSVLVPPLALLTCQVLPSHWICRVTAEWTSQCLCHQETVLWQVGTWTHWIVCLIWYLCHQSQYNFRFSNMLLWFVPLIWHFFQALHWSWSCYYDAHGLFILHAGWSKHPALLTSHRYYTICHYQLALIDIDWLLCVAVAWFEWYSHGFLLWYCNVTLYLAQCNREFQGHNQVSICIVCIRNTCESIIWGLNFADAYAIVCTTGAFATLSFICGMFLFLYVGMDDI